MIDEVIDFFADGFSYIFGFEWVGDVTDFFGSAFENIGQISIVGTILGAGGIVFIHLLRVRLLNPFLVHMGTFEALFWKIATYISIFIVGYLVGKFLENT